WHRKISHSPEHTPPKEGGSPQSQALVQPSCSNHAKLARMAETLRMGVMRWACTARCYARSARRGSRVGSRGGPDFPYDRGMTRCPSSPFLASLLFFAACSTLSAAPQSEPKSQASGASEATKGDQSSGADAEKSDKDKDTEKSEEPKLAITEHTV